MKVIYKCLIVNYHILGKILLHTVRNGFYFNSKYSDK